jgi:hypothetical protein
MIESDARWVVRGAARCLPQHRPRPAHSTSQTRPQELKYSKWVSASRARRATLDPAGPAGV